LVDDESMDIHKKKHVDTFGKMPKGDYLVAVNPNWTQFAKAHPELMELKVRVATSKAKVTAEYMSDADGVKLAAGGKAVLHEKQGLSCYWRGKELPIGTSMAEAATIAKKEKAQYFLYPKDEVIGKFTVQLCKKPCERCVRKEWRTCSGGWCQYRVMEVQGYTPPPPPAPPVVKISDAAFGPDPEPVGEASVDLTAHRKANAKELAVVMPAFDASNY